MGTNKNNVLLPAVRSKMPHGPRGIVVPIPIPIRLVPLPIRLKRALHTETSSSIRNNKENAIHYVFALPQHQIPDETHISNTLGSNTKPKEKETKSDERVVTAIVRGTQQIWKPYSASYIE